MNKILQLREKRAKLWEETKDFLESRKDEKDQLTAEDTTTYEKMEQEVVNLGKTIERLERQATMELELTKTINTPIKNKPNNDNYQGKTGRASNNYKEAFWKAMRSKNSYEIHNALKEGELSEGGYLVPDEFEKTLIEALEEENIIRQLSTIITTSSGDKKIPISVSKGTASWVEEEGNIPESDDTFGQISIGAYKLATMIKISEELIQDSVFNLQNYIAKEFARRIATKEEEAFITGDGTGKPTGILSEIGGAELGVTTTAPTSIKFDEIIDLYYSLKAPYRKKASFITNDATIKVIRKLKDGNGQYLWTPSIKAGEPDTLLNQPITTSTYMPNIEAGAKILTYGDYRNYWIADRQGRSFQRLNELYAITGQIGFRATQRVDGKLILPESIKYLQMKKA